MKFVKHLHSMQTVRDLTTTFRLCSYPVRLISVSFRCAVSLFVSLSLSLGGYFFHKWNERVRNSISSSTSHKITVALCVNLLLNTRKHWKFDFIPIITPQFERKENCEHEIKKHTHRKHEMKKRNLNEQLRVKWRKMKIHINTNHKFKQWFWFENWFLRAH